MIEAKSWMLLGGRRQRKRDVQKQKLRSYRGDASTTSFMETKSQTEELLGEGIHACTSMALQDLSILQETIGEAVIVEMEGMITFAAIFDTLYIMYR